MCKQTCAGCGNWAWSCFKCGANLRGADDLVCTEWHKHFCDKECLDKHAKGYPVKWTTESVEEEECVAAEHGYDCNKY